MKLLRLLIALMALTAMASYSEEAAKATVSSAAEGGFIYTMKAGETMKDVAIRYMGGAEYLPELLAYNKLSNPLLAKEGFHVGIPGSERQVAIKAIANARDALAVALEAEAGMYAKDELKLAQETFDATTKARQEGAYVKATNLAKLVTARAQAAKQTADIRAPVQQPAKLSAAHGEVTISDDGEQNWRPISAGAMIPVHAVVRTGYDSRAELTLADGSVVQMQEASRFAMRNFVYDRRDGKRDAKLEVLMGRILGKIKPKKVESSNVQIRTHNANLAIRGTDLRVGADEHSSQVALLDGKSTVSTANQPVASDADDEQVDVPSNYGTYVTGKRPPKEPVYLLPPPRALIPPAGASESSKQLFMFHWAPVDDKRFRNFHFELAKDQEFNQPVSEVFTLGTSHSAGILPEGVYYWRVATVDKNGLEGKSTGGKLTITLDLNLTFLTDNSQYVVREKRWVVGPENAIYVRPRVADSSVLTMEVQINDQPFRRMYDKIVLRDEGITRISVRGIGGEGSIGTLMTQDVELDLTAPTVHAAPQTVQEDEHGRHSVRVELSADDTTGVKHVLYRLHEDDDFVIYHEPLVVDVDKPVTLQYHAEDVVGNVSDTETRRLDRFMNALDSDL